MEAHLQEESKLWSVEVLWQSQSRMQGGKTEESNMKFRRIATVGHILSTLWSLFHAYYMSFQSSGSEESNTLNGEWIGVETKKLWLFEDNCIKLCEISQPKAHFAATKWAAKWPVKMFLGCEPPCEITSKLRMKLQIISKLRNHLQVVKSPLSCKTKVQTCKMDNLTCESPCEIHLCKLRYLQLT